MHTHEWYCISSVSKFLKRNKTKQNKTDRPTDPPDRFPGQKGKQTFYFFRPYHQGISVHATVNILPLHGLHPKKQYKQLKLKLWWWLKEKVKGKSFTEEKFLFLQCELNQCQQLSNSNHGDVVIMNYHQRLDKISFIFTSISKKSAKLLQENSVRHVMKPGRAFITSTRRSHRIAIKFNGHLHDRVFLLITLLISQMYKVDKKNLKDFISRW